MQEEEEEEERRNYTTQKHLYCRSPCSNPTETSNTYLHTIEIIAFVGLTVHMVGPIYIIHLLIIKEHNVVINTLKCF